MSTAPDIETIYRVEDEVEKGIKTILTGLGITAYTQQQDAEVVAPFVDVQLSLGDHTGHQWIDKNGGIWEAAWNATLALRVVTKRGDGGTDHVAWRSKIRVAMQYASQKLTESVLPYHTLSKVSTEGATPIFESDNDYDVSDLRFSVIVCVRTNAWPASLRA